MPPSCRWGAALLLVALFAAVSGDETATVGVDAAGEASPLGGDGAVAEAAPPEIVARLSLSLTRSGKEEVVDATVRLGEDAVDGALRFVAPELRDPERARAAKKRVDYLGPALAASRRSFHLRWSRADDDLEVAELAPRDAVDVRAALRVLAQLRRRLSAE